MARSDCDNLLGSNLHRERVWPLGIVTSRYASQWQQLFLIFYLISYFLSLFSVTFKIIIALCPALQRVAVQLPIVEYTVGFKQWFETCTLTILFAMRAP